MLTKDDYDHLRRALDFKYDRLIEALLKEKAAKLEALDTVFGISAEAASAPPRTATGRLQFGTVGEAVYGAVVKLIVGDEPFTVHDVIEVIRKDLPQLASHINPGSVSSAVRRLSLPKEPDDIPILEVVEPGIGRAPSRYRRHPQLLEETQKALSEPSRSRWHRATETLADFAREAATSEPTETTSAPPAADGAASAEPHEQLSQRRTAHTKAVLRRQRDAEGQADTKQVG